MYACIIADIIENFGGNHCKALIMGDVTYGACCIDDYTAQKLNADFMIHYGHSCLVPINVTQIPVMYVFVEIKFDSNLLVQTILHNFKEEQELVIMGTVQFLSAVYEVQSKLKVCSIEDRCIVFLFVCRNGSRRFMCHRPNLFLRERRLGAPPLCSRFCQPQLAVDKEKMAAVEGQKWKYRKFRPHPTWWCLSRMDAFTWRPL